MPKRARTWDEFVEHFLERVVHTADGHWIAPASVNTRRWVIWCRNQSGKLVPKDASRIAWKIKHGEWPAFRLISTCGNAECFRPEHMQSLDVVTGDALRLLSKDEALQMVREYEHSGQKTALIAARYGVSRSTCYSYLRGLVYPDVCTEQRNQCKLDWNMVRAIRAARVAGHGMQRIADEFDVDISCISLIVNKKRWWPDPQEASK